jgi:hypothetical protein
MHPHGERRDTFTGVLRLVAEPVFTFTTTWRIWRNPFRWGAFGEANFRGDGALERAGAYYAGFVALYVFVVHWAIEFYPEGARRFSPGMPAQFYEATKAILHRFKIAASDQEIAIDMSMVDLLLLAIALGVVMELAIWPTRIVAWRWSLWLSPKPTSRFGETIALFLYAMLASLHVQISILCIMCFAHGVTGTGSPGSTMLDDGLFVIILGAGYGFYVFALWWLVALNANTWSRHAYTTSLVALHNAFTRRS